MEDILECATLLEFLPAAVPLCQELLFQLREMIRYMQDACDEHIRRNALGRPAIVVQVDQLHFFVENGFKVKDIALLLRCSKRTVERRMHTYGLSSRNYTVIGDAELDEIVGGVTSVFPRCGQKVMDGRLRAQSVHACSARAHKGINEEG